MGIFMSFLVIFTLIILIVWKFIFVNHFKYSYLFYFYKTKIDKNNNFTKLGAYTFSIFCIILYFLLRWLKGLDSVIKFDLINQPPSAYRSSNLSGIFMLDLCSLASIITPLLVLFDFKKKILLRPFSILCILGGFLAILFAAPVIYTKWSIKDFFLGSNQFGINEDSPLTFIIHFWMTIIGSQVLIWSNKFKIKDFLILFSIGFAYFLYVLIMVKIFNIESDATGLVKGDFFKLNDSYYIFSFENIQITSTVWPTYITFTNILGSDKNWIFISMFAWFSFILFALLICFSKNIFVFFQKKKRTNIVYY